MYQSWWRGLAKVMFLRTTVLALFCPFISDPFNSSLARSFGDQSFLYIICIYYSPYNMYIFIGVRTSRVSTVVSPHFVLTTNDIHNKALTSSNILRYRGFSVCFLPTTLAFCSVDKAFPRTFSVACLKQEPRQGECTILYFHCSFVYLTFLKQSFDKNRRIAFPYTIFLSIYLNVSNDSRRYTPVIFRRSQSLPLLFFRHVFTLKGIKND